MTSLAATGSANQLDSICNRINPLTIDVSIALPYFGPCLGDRQTGNIIVFSPSTAAPRKRLSSSDLDESTVNGAKPLTD